VSYAVDTNVLLYASDAASPHHKAARAFLTGCVERGEVVCLAWPVLMGYLRIATHSGVFHQALDPDEAMRNVESLLDLPHSRVITEEEGFWTVYREAVGDLPVRGALVPDAHLAALLRQHGVRRLYTRDRDFLKFPFLEVRDPLVPEPFGA
jgi:toxin-antitoxin system PIN domain toxin